VAGDSSFSESLRYVNISPGFLASLSRSNNTPKKLVFGNNDQFDKLFMSKVVIVDHSSVLLSPVTTKMVFCNTQ
jgi:hypothetical protein